jgi:hypothetical protein
MEALALATMEVLAQALALQLQQWALRKSSASPLAEPPLLRRWASPLLAHLPWQNCLPRLSQMLAWPGSAESSLGPALHCWAAPPAVARSEASVVAGVVVEELLDCWLCW